VVLTFSAFFHTIPIFGGTAAHLHGPFHTSEGEASLEPVGTTSAPELVTDQNVHAMTAGLYTKSFSMVAAGARAVDMIAARLRLQATALAYLDGFLLIGGAVHALLIFVALLRKSL